jgi:hypothetical protein
MRDHPATQARPVDELVSSSSRRLRDVPRPASRHTRPRATSPSVPRCDRDLDPKPAKLTAQTRAASTPSGGHWRHNRQIENHQSAALEVRPKLAKYPDGNRNNQTGNGPSNSRGGPEPRAKPGYTRAHHCRPDYLARASPNQRRAQPRLCEHRYCVAFGATRERTLRGGAEQLQRHAPTPQTGIGDTPGPPLQEPVPRSKTCWLKMAGTISAA